MKIYMLRAIFFCLFFLAAIPAMSADYVGLVTGSKTGTYFQVGKDIAEVTAKYGLNIKVKPSQGSLNNIERMNSSENAAFGIVQSDVLGILNKNQPAVAANLRMVYPLYNEEVHLFAGKNIKRFKDLQGKKVATGTKGSGNWLTLANLLHKMKVKPAQKITGMDPLDAVIAVLEGKIDAMIYVSGKPVKLFKKLNELKKTKKFSRLMDEVHMVPLTDPKMTEEYYVSSSLGRSDYKWMNKRVPTIAVKALLVSFDFSKQNSPYYQKRCRNLKTIATAIRENYSYLRQNGHKKWQTVDLDAGVGRWKKDRCAHPNVTTKSKTELYDTLQDIFKD